MMKKLMLAVLGVMMVLGLAQVGLTQGAYAVNKELCKDSSIDDEIRAAAGCDTTQTAGNFIINLINIALTVIGIVTVIVIIYGGIMYATSLGDAAKAAKAKNTIIFGVIGLVVAILAFAIVNFISVSVLKGVDGVGTNNGGTSANP